MKLRDLPNFPPIWQTRALTERSGLIGTLRYIKADWKKKHVVMVVEDGELLIGHYTADVETLKELVLLLTKQVGRTLTLIAETKLSMLVFVSLL